MCLQVPFQDGPHWRTLSLGLEPDREGTTDDTGRPTGFRVMMHVPLSGLGETWIDAGADGPRLRAVMYLSDAAARERVRPELAGLRAGFAGGRVRRRAAGLKPTADLTDRQRRRANAIRAGRSRAGRGARREGVSVADPPRKQAVALRYDTQQEAAPKVVAKGQGAIADKILELARRTGVAVREDRDLVTVLSKLDFDREIPPQLFAAVATILAFLYRTNKG